MAKISPTPSASIRDLVTAFVTLIGTISAVPTLSATLDYGTFRGAYSSAYNISYWTKILFAAPPVGENRFRALNRQFLLEMEYMIHVKLTIPAHSQR